MGTGRFAHLPLLLALTWGCNFLVGDFESIAGAGGAGGSSSTTGLGGAGGIGGASSSGGLGGGGGGGGSRPTLTDDGLLVRYYLDETAEGQGPNTIVDSAPPPTLGLSVQYTGAPTDSNPTFVTDEGHRGIRFDIIDSGAMVMSAVSGSKIIDALAAHTGATIEVVAKLESVDPAGSTLFRLGDSSGNRWLSLDAFSPNALRFRWQGSTSIGNWTADVTERTVLHVVLDTTQTVSSGRLLLYRDGVEVANLSTTAPSQDQGISFDSTGDVMTLGNNNFDFHSMMGTLFYVALYQRPLTSSEVLVHTEVLEASDDTPL